MHIEIIAAASVWNVFFQFSFNVTYPWGPAEGASLSVHPPPSGKNAIWGPFCYYFFISLGSFFMWGPFILLFLLGGRPFCPYGSPFWGCPPPFSTKVSAGAHGRNRFFLYTFHIHVLDTVNKPAKWLSPLSFKPL